MRWGVFRIWWRRLNDLDPHHRLSSALDLRHPLLAPWGDLLRTLSLYRLQILHSLEHSVVREHPAHQPEEQVDPLSITYCLPTSASLHGAGCPGKANLTFQRNMYLDLTHVSIFPPAVRASELLQVEIFGRQLVTLLYNPAPRITCCATNWGGSGSLWPPTLLWRQVVPLNKAFVLFFFCCLPLCGQHDYSQFMTWLGKNPSALKEIT